MEAVTDIALIDAMIEELERLPSQPSVAMKVVWIADDPTSSAKGLANAIAADPSLTSRVLKLANSAYYGLSGRVGNVGFAVTVIGFPTVRAMAAATASGLFTPGEEVAPYGFWEHALAVASAASKLSDRLGIRPPDAFSLGLLHDLGSTLLFRSDPARYDELIRRSMRERIPLPVLEREEYGMSHDSIAARIFGAWRFPDSFVDAVARHHDPVDWRWEASTRLLVAAEAVAARLPRAPTFELTGSRDDGLAAMGITTLDATRLASAVKEEATELLAAFS
jgi:putative nucleotidyltransferase with HDIG domain